MDAEEERVKREPDWRWLFPVGFFVLVVVFSYVQAC
jgi:hypothetical protein